MISREQADSQSLSSTTSELQAPDKKDRSKTDAFLLVSMADRELWAASPEKWEKR